MMLALLLVGGTTVSVSSVGDKGTAARLIDGGVWLCTPKQVFDTYKQCVDGLPEQREWQVDSGPTATTRCPHGTWLLRKKYKFDKDAVPISLVDGQKEQDCSFGATRADDCRFLLWKEAGSHNYVYTQKHVVKNPEIAAQPIMMRGGAVVVGVGLTAAAYKIIRYAYLKARFFKDKAISSEAKEGKVAIENDKAQEIKKLKRELVKKKNKRIVGKCDGKK